MTIWIKEIIRNANGTIIDTVCEMDGFRSHMDPKSLIEIYERDHNAVGNYLELMEVE